MTDELQIPQQMKMASAVTKEILPLTSQYRALGNSSDRVTAEDHGIIICGGRGGGEDRPWYSAKRFYLEKRFDFRNKEDKATKQKVFVCAITCF